MGKEEIAVESFFNLIAMSVWRWRDLDSALLLGLHLPRFGSSVDVRIDRAQSASQEDTMVVVEKSGFVVVVLLKTQGGTSRMGSHVIFSLR